MSVEDVAKLIRVVERSFDDVPRNDYEGNNRYFSNVERLTEIGQRLATFKGARIDELTARAESLGRLNEQRKPGSGAAVPNQTAASAGGAPGNDNAFSLDFVAQEEEDGENVDELQRAEEAMAKVGKKKKDKKAANKAEKETSKQEKKESKKEKEGNDVAKVSVDNAATDGGGEEPVKSMSKGAGTSPVPAADRYLSAVTLDMECPSSSIPADVVGTAGVCSLVAETALAVVDFPNVPIDVDGKACVCRVEMYRCVLLALVNGGPVAPLASISGPGNDSGSGAAALAAQVLQQDEEASGDEPGEDAETLEDEAAEDEMFLDKEAEQLQKLSQELISQYDSAQAEKEEIEASTSFPSNFPARFTTSLRQATYLRWVVLMCMGGYFAGGVFVNGKCIKHKAFQRYVVRKKQGGRQSTNAKGGGGSYGSIGSQIRLAQEVKWKLDVRDLLLAWRAEIDAAAFILYVAPGPQNRTMLTDFSTLPPPAGGGKRKESPIRVDDERVRRAPLTAHRPTFKEVQRIYDTVSKFNVCYFPAAE